MWQQVIRQTTSTAAGLALCLAALSWAGCARRTAWLPQRYDAAGIPHSFKRHEQFPQRDFLHHFVRRAYRKPAVWFGPKEGTDPAVTFKQWGKPDWIRKPFRSFQNERVKEWIYLDKQRIFQFTGGQLVYEGPLTDYEQCLIARGYPDRTEQTFVETGTDGQIFVYTKVFAPWLEEFHFVNGMVLQSQEGY